MVDVVYTTYGMRPSIGSYAGADTRVFRTETERLGDIVNVKEFGATGNGTTNDTNAIKRAIRFAGLSGYYARRGSILFFPPGTYKVTEQLILDQTPQTVPAYGNVYFFLNPTNGSTLVVNGVTITFTTGATSGLSIHIGADIATTIDTLVTQMNASSNPSLTPYTYTAVSTPDTYPHNTLYIQADVAGGFPVPPATFLVFRCDISTTVAGAFIAGTWGSTSSPTQSNINLNIMGAGRDASIIRGDLGIPGSQMDVADLPNGFLLRSGYQAADGAGKDFSGDSTLRVSDITLWNDSVVPNSGCYITYNSGNQMQFENVHFHGFVGLVMQANTFFGRVQNCTFTCSAPKTAANAATLAPLYTSAKIAPSTSGRSNLFASIGLCNGGSTVINCRFDGFDFGLINSGNIQGYGLYFSRCSVGLCYGYRTAGTVENVAAPGNWIQGNYLTVKGAWFDRCKWGVWSTLAVGTIHSACTFTGTTGPTDPAPLVNTTGLSWSGGTVTATCQAAHNITEGATVQIINSTTLAPLTAWTNNNNGCVVAHVTGATTFTFTGPGSSPGAFTTGSWNYPMEYCFACSHNEVQMYMACRMDAIVSKAGFTCYEPDGGHFDGNQGDNTIWCCPAPYGWTPVPGLNKCTTAYRFEQCYTPTQLGAAQQNPGNWSVYGELPVTGATGQKGPYQEQMFTITSCAAQPNIGGSVYGGGSNRYKVRYTGAPELTITSAVPGGGNIVYTTASPHGLSVGNIVFVNAIPTGYGFTPTRLGTADVKAVGGGGTTFTLEAGDPGAAFVSGTLNDQWVRVG